jgi:hypothetical protein
MADPSTARDTLLNEHGVSDQPMAADPPPNLAAHDPTAHARTSTRRSRRTLLKLGGAAAAAGVAAVAAGATELAHPGVAEAAVTWTTGTVNEDVMTLVQGTDGSGHLANSPALLTVQTGQFSTFIPLANTSTPWAAIAAYDNSGFTTHQAIYATSADGNAIVGKADIGTGVIGGSNTGDGVFGYSTSANGVAGSSTNGPGVGGGSVNSNGVIATSTNGTALAAESANWVGGFFQGPIAQIMLQSNPGIGAPTTGPHSKGMIFADQNATLWVCINGDGSTVGTWVRLTGVSSTAAGGAITYLSTPVRLLDARSSASSGLVNRGALAGNEVYTFAVAGLGGSGIPSSAQGLIGNVTILGPSGTGNLSLYPAGGAVPTVASMTFGSPGLFLANGVNVAIGSGGAINIQNQSSGTTPLVLDAVAFVS